MALRHDFERFPLNGEVGVRVGFPSMAYVGGFWGHFFGGSFLRARASSPTHNFLDNSYSLGGLKGIAWGRGEGNSNTTVFSYRGTQGGFLFMGEGRKGGTLKKMPSSADSPKNGDN